MSDPTASPLIVSVGDLIEEIAVRLAAPWRRGSDATAAITTRRGGSAANVAVAAAAAGGRARFIGAVGDDAAGSALERALIDAGVEPQLQRHGRSARIIVIVEPDGERTMLPDRAAALTLSITASPEPALLQGVAHLHAPAYSLIGEPLASSTRNLFAAAATAGLTTSLDASSVGALAAWGPEASREHFASLRPDLLFANEEEADYLGLLARPLAGATLILKRGPGEAEVRNENGEILARLPAPPIDGWVDSTGAGDAFAGGLLVTHAGGASWEDALAAGHAAARRHLLAQREDQR